MTKARWRAKRSVDYQHENQARGRCRLCSSPLAYGSIAHCAAHVLAKREKNRARVGAKAWRLGGPGRPPLAVTA